MRRLVLLSTILLACACSPEEGATWECGDGPVVLLELETGQEAIVMDAGDRLVHQVRDPDGSYRLLSTDRCGADPRPVAAGVRRPIPLPSGDLVATTCSAGEDAGAVVLVDLLGNQDPLTLAEDVWCNSVTPWSDGFLAMGHVDGQRTGPLLRHSGGVLEQLTGPIRQLEVMTGGDRALVLETSGRLSRIELASGQSTELLAGAVRFAAGAGGGLLWQSLPGTGGTAPVHLRTRDGTDVTVTDSYTPLSPPYDTFAWTADGEHAYLVGELGYIIGPWRADDATTLPPPHPGLGGGWPYGSALADGSVWLIGQDGDDRLHVRWRPSSGEQLELWREPKDTYPSAAVVDGELGLARALFADGYADTGALTLYPHDGGAPRPLLDEAGRTLIAAGGRLLTVVPDGAGTGELVAVNLVDGAVNRLDQAILATPAPQVLSDVVVYHTAAALMAAPLP